jgi:hypothetical protein
MAAACAQHDLNAGLVRPEQRVTVLLRKFYLGVQQGAIEVDSDKADGALHVSILPSCPMKIRRIEFRERSIYTPQKPNRNKRKIRFALALPST